MPAKYLRPSPNELHRLQTEEQQRIRIERIKAVRSHSSTSSQAIRKRYQHQSSQEWSRTLSQLQQSFSTSLEEQVNYWHEVQDRHLESIGKGQRDAQLDIEKTQRSIEELRRRTAERFKEEALRSTAAGQAFNNEREAESAYRTAIAEQRKQALLTAYEREHYVASLPPPPSAHADISVPSLPIQVANRLNQTGRGGPPANFRTTTYHDPAATAVRCIASSDTETKRSAWQDAERARAKALRDQAERALRSKRLEERAEIRGEKAMDAVKMDKQAEMMFKELEELGRRDRRLKMWRNCSVKPRGGAAEKAAEKERMAAFERIFGVDTEIL
ncbi:hypothetical protein BC832DRAFT_594569 [Gaertneriomyces semiglobifer]|nr:hypothetical protein BC832DRAFT_594569 [Gaertneriomyces semiglobifer]